MTEREDFTDFPALRESVHKDMSMRLSRRLQQGSMQKTPLEEGLGAYKEEIEPQVWHAVKVMNRKGYKTVSSGFAGVDSERQQIDGPFFLDRETKEKLAAVGVCVIPYPASYIPGQMIIFYPKRTSLPEITATWNRVAAVLPFLNKPSRRNPR